LGGRLDQRARELAGVLHDRTAGNPYFIRELIAHLEESGSTIAAPAGDMGAELDLPDGLLNVIAQRVARLSDGARLTLDAAAVAGQRFSLALLERVLSDAPTTLDAIEEATAAGLLTDVGHGEYGFAHALVREAVYQRLTSGRRSRLHRRIGEALEADVSAARVEALAHHFAKAAADGQELKAARYAIAAARDAMQRLGYEEAVSHCRRGLEALARTASQFPRERGELLVTLGEAWWSIGDVEAAQQVCLEASELAESLGDPLLLAQAALVFAGPLWIPSSDEAARPSVELLESALAGLAPDQLRSALGARVMARLSACLVPGDADARRTSLSARGLEIAREIGDAATLANALAMRHWVSAGPDNVEDQLAIASELAAVAQSLGDRRQELEARVWVLDHQLERANADGVRRELAVLQRLAENLDDRRARWILIIATGRQAHLAGRLEEFEALAHQGLASSIQGEDESATQIFGGQMIALRREQQRLDEVVETLERFVGDFPAVVVWRSTLAYVYAELGRHAQARDQLDWLSQESFTRVPRDTWWLSSAAMLAEVAAALDDAPRAQELYDALLPYSDRCVVISGTLCQGAVARLLGLLATTIDQFDEAERHLAAARDINAAVGARLWLLHTRYNEASMLLRRANPGDRDRARDILDDVVSSATPLGLSTLETRARASLGSIIQAGRSPATPRP
jgi:tetratricopeptide (TPR) repeat protein